ncbi:hypothetical protein F5Y14DRAFT_425095 [Nemania sp. NC0429]|nr:hypothetical protein F5Y14DRAFT_425095 [Nemania sp. NC0429]
MSSSQPEEVHRFWASQWTSMSDHHYEERMRFNREMEEKKQRVIDNARLQLEYLRKRDLPPAYSDLEAQKIGSDRDVALEAIEKDHKERMRAVLDIQLKEIEDHQKAHKEAIAARSLMNSTSPANPAVAQAAAAASPTVGSIRVAKGASSASGSRTPTSGQPGPISHHRLLDDPTPSIRFPREQDRPTAPAPKKTFSCTAKRESANGKEQYILRYKTKNRKALQKIAESRAKPTPHADQSGVSSALTTNNEPRVPKTVSFDEVYQNGQAEHKDTIVEFPTNSGKWYILKCEEHNLRFNRRPIQGAGKHLMSRLHGVPDRSWATAIRELGYRVNCNKELAELNNKAVDDAYANGYRPAGLAKAEKTQKKRGPNDKTIAKRAQKVSAKASVHGRASFSSSPRKRKRPEIDSNPGIINPKAFHIYECRWQTHVYPAVILGWDDLKPGGLEIRLSGTGLLDKTSNPPKCYIYHNAAIIGWAPGFEDGGPMVNKRKFPARFFDNRFAWVPAKWLKEFPLYKSDPPKKESHLFNQAREWIAKREGFASWKAFEEKQKGKANEETTSSVAALSAATPSVATPSASALPSTDDSDSETDDSFTSSSISNVTEKELAEMQERAGEISGDGDYSDSEVESTSGGGDTQGAWAEIEADGRPWAFYSLRKQAQVKGYKAGPSAPVDKSDPARAKATSPAQRATKKEPRDESLNEAPEDLELGMNGDGSGNTSVKSHCVAHATEQVESQIERPASVYTTQADNGPTCAPALPLRSVIKPGDIAKGVKRVRSDEALEIDAGASEPGSGKKPRLDMDAPDVRMTISVEPEPLAMSVTPSLEPKVPLGPAVFELSSYRKGFVSWASGDERSSIRLYYGEGNGTVGSVDGPVNIVIDPKTIRALAQEKIPESRGNVLVTLLGQNPSDAPAKLVFDKAKGSKMDIGKIQVRGFIRWLKSINHTIRLLDDRETAEELRKVANLPQ